MAMGKQFGDYYFGFQDANYLTMTYDTGYSFTVRGKGRIAVACLQNPMFIGLGHGSLHGAGCPREELTWKTDLRPLDK